MANELIRPIDADTARAIEEGFKSAQKGTEAVMKGGGYVGAVLGDLPQDLVGYLGDWVKHKRLRRLAELMKETQRILHERGIDDADDVSPSVAVPLIDAAINEDRDGLKELWSKLLAAAVDSRRSNLVRPSIIELLKNLDPLDARILQLWAGQALVGNGDAADRMLAALGAGTDRDQVFFSLEHLYELKCLAHSPNDVPVPGFTAKARLLIRAVT